MRAPQQCPNCKVSLADPTVPLKFFQYRRLFTRAYEVIGEKKRTWGCPDCGHEWPKS